MPEARIYLSGQTLRLNGDDILSFAISADTGGIGMGKAVSAKYTLSFVKKEGIFHGDLIGRRVETFFKGRPLGVWYINSCDMRADSALITVAGQDAIGAYLSAEFSDSSAAYPRTALALLRTVISACPGLTLKRADFPGADARISSMPLWPKGVTLRQVAAYIAFLAGGIARVNLDGEFEIVPLSEEPVAVSGDVSLSGGREFAFNCLRYRFEGDDAYTRYAVAASVRDTASNTVAASGNPLATVSALRRVASQLSGVRAEGGAVKAFDVPRVFVGERFTCEGHAMYASALRFTLDSKGPVTVVSSGVPSAASVPGGGVFNPDGTLCADAIGGFEDRILGVSRAYIGALTADEIISTGLTTRFAEAVKLTAQQASAQELTAHFLTSALAEIVNISARKLSAGQTETDELSAGVARLLSAKVNSLDADSLMADELAASLARFAVIAAGSAEFDRESVKHLLANALNVRDAVGEKVFIDNLTVDYADMITANVGSLVVGASNGNFYRLNVDSAGSVTAEPVSVTDEERAAGSTAEGRTVLETNIAAENLSAGDIKAVTALINRLDAARIDVGELTAQRAYIDHLSTADISHNRSIRAAIEAGENTARYMSFDEDGLTQRVPGSVYFTSIDNHGFSVRSDEEVRPLATMNAADGIAAQKLRLGKIRCRATSKGGWAWQSVEE